MNIGYKKLNSNNQKEMRSMRENQEAIRNRAELLDEPDRTLIKMYLDNQNSFRQIAHLTGVNQATVARRIKKIMDRLNNNQSWCKLRYAEWLKSSERKYAKEYFIKGKSIRAIANKYNVSYHTIRRIIRRINKPAKNWKHKVTQRFY